MRVLYGSVLLIAGSVSAQNCATPASRVVSWWPGEGSTADLVGGNPGTLVGGTSFTGGVVGQAFSFDGFDDRVIVPDNPNLHITGSLTIEGWILVISLPSVPSGHGQIVFRGDDRGGLDPYYLSMEPTGALRFHVQDENSVDENLEVPIPALAWLHVSATLDDATAEMRIYLNGSLAAQTITNVRPFASLDPSASPFVGIGNHGGQLYNQPFHGLIDELSVYDVALTAAEVQALYAAGAAGKCHVPGTLTPFGAGCAGTMGTPTLTLAAGQPSLGTSFTLQLNNLPVGILRVPFGLLGASNTAAFGFPLPLSLEPFGMSGCELYVSPDLGFQLSNFGGVASWPIAIPTVAGLLGQAFYVQGAVFDPGANAAGLTVSNAGAAVAGIR